MGRITKGVFFSALLLVSCLALFAACDSGGGGGNGGGSNGVIANVKVTEAGVLSWDAVNNAEQYTLVNGISALPSAEREIVASPSFDLTNWSLKLGSNTITILAEKRDPDFDNMFVEFDVYEATVKLLGTKYSIDAPKVYSSNYITYKGAESALNNGAITVNLLSSGFGSIFSGGYKLSEYVTVPEGHEWRLYKDEDFTNEVTDKAVARNPLVRNYYYYIAVIKDGDLKASYPLLIHELSQVTVTMTDIDGDPKYSATVMELDYFDTTLAFDEMESSANALIDANGTLYNTGDILEVKGDTDFYEVPATDTPLLQSFKINYSRYNIVIAKYIGTAAETEIPETMFGVPVKTIASDAFNGNENITGVTASYAEYIGLRAFKGCTSLTRVTFDALIEIGVSAFEGCTALGDITLGENLTAINEKAFYGCASLFKLTLPASVLNLYADVFTNSALKALIINRATSTNIPEAGIGFSESCYIFVPNGSVSTYKYAVNWTNFSGQIYSVQTLSGDFIIDGTNITAYLGNGGVLEIPTGVTQIPSGVFERNKAITSVILPESITTISYGAFQYCTELTAINLPSGLDSVAGYAFYNCAKLLSITFPENAGIKIGRLAFAGCTKLANAVFETGSVSELGEEAFIGCTALTEITVPGGVTDAWKAFKDCTGITKVSFGAGTTKIFLSMFEGCTALTNITIPNTVTEIASDAFLNTGCFNNAQNNSVVYLGGWVIGVKGTVTDAVITEGTIGIAGGAFSISESPLKSVTIAASVKFINSRAFSMCTQLSAVTFAPNSGLLVIGSNAFANCYDLVNISLPSSLTSIGSLAFSYCTGLTSITLPASVTKIESSAFSDCEKLETIYVERPSSLGVTEITASVFWYTPLNKKIYVPDSASATEYKKATGWSSYADNIFVKP